MKSITIGDKDFIPFLSAQMIVDRVGHIAAQINVDYKDKQPVFLAVLNGSFVFAADLMRQVTVDAEITFVKLSSYTGTASSGSVRTEIGLEQRLYERDVIILEDIIDTGRTLHEFLSQLHQLQPASVKIVTLLSKPEALKYQVHADYFGFIIPDKFVVGYGLDYNGKGRNLSEIYQLKP